MRIRRIRRIFWKCVTKRIRETNLLKIDWIRDSRYKTNLLKSGFVIHDTVRIHGFAKRIHVFTNLLYESRNLKNYTYLLYQLELRSKLNMTEDVEQVSVRVLNKLTLCINPSTVILPNVSNLTGLDNYNLESQKIFTCQTAQVCKKSFNFHLTLVSCMMDLTEEKCNTL